MSEEEAEKLFGNYAFISGLIYGWASRLEELTVDEFGKHDVQTFKLIEEMKEQGARLATFAGVKLK